MSFNLTRIGETKLIDVNHKYKQLAEEFCKFYYSTYYKNFKDLANSYHPKAQFTVNDIEVSGVNNFFIMISLRVIEPWSENHSRFICRERLARDMEGTKEKSKRNHQISGAGV